MIHSILKKIFLCLGLISLITPQSLIRAEHNLSDLQPLCLTHNQLLEAQLLPLMHEIETSLDYWNTIEESPFSYAIIRGPNGWISSKTAQEDIADHQTILVQKQQELACALGELVQFSAHHTTQSQEEILAAIASCFHITDRLLTGNAVSNTIYTPEQLITQGTQAIERLTTFSTQFSTQLEPHIKPNHFIRHWTKYAAGAGSLLVAALYAYTHQEKLHTWHTKGQDALFHFWKNNITEPIYNTYSILFDKKHNGIVTNESLEGKREVLRKGLQKLLSEKFTTLSPETIRSQVEHIMITKDMRIVQEDLQLQLDTWGERIASEIYAKLNTPGKWALWPLYSPNSSGDNKLRIGQDVNLIYQRTLLTADEVLQKIQLLVELSAIVPTLYVAEKSYDYLFHKKLVCEPLQNRMRLIDKLLNKYNTPDLSLDITAIGFLHYHLSALHYYVSRIPSNKQQAFTADIEELDNPALNVAQKMRVIDQMYREYSFLHALPV